MIGSRRRQPYHKNARLADLHIFDGIPAPGMTLAHAE